mgnify:CR=1 FL=1
MNGASQIGGNNLFLLCRAKGVRWGKVYGFLVLRINKMRFFRQKFLLLFLLVFCESMFLMAEDEKKLIKSIVWEQKLATGSSANHLNYEAAIGGLFMAHENMTGLPLSPSKLGAVGLKVDTAAGAGLSTPLPLVRAVIESLERRGFERSAILILDYSAFNLKAAGFLEEAGCAERGAVGQFAGCPVLALDSFAHFEREWFYDSPIPPLLKDQAREQNPYGQELITEEDLGLRKSFLPIPLMFEVDFWINLAVGVEDPILGVEATLANASLFNVSNHRRFYTNQSAAAVAIAEISAIPELREKLYLNFLSLERYQFIGGPQFDAYYARSKPLLWMSDDPVALDRMLLALINRERRENGFEEISQPNLQLDYAAKIGLGTNDLSAIEKRYLREAEESIGTRAFRFSIPTKN